MNLKLSSVVLSASLVVCALISSSPSSQAQDGYKFTPVPTYKNVKHDPNGTWDDSNFSPFGNPPRYPTIYIARLTTPKGEWILSQLDSACSMQGNCQFILQLKDQNGLVKTVAEGSGILGHPITLSLNYRKVFTEEISQDIKGFIGTYDVNIEN